MVPSASGDYAAIFLSQLDRATEIENAGYDIGDKLEIDPTGNGTHVCEGLRRIASEPLVALYSIDGNDVSVDAVRWIG